MNTKTELSICWLRRDLRWEDNTALQNALNKGCPVLVLFIFDKNILEELNPNDGRVSFIHQELLKINNWLSQFESSISVYHNDTKSAWKEIINEHDVKNVFWNRDYEPYATKRDNEITAFLENKGISVFTFKDHVVFEPNEILKADGKPYAIYTPFKNKWLEKFKTTPLSEFTEIKIPNFVKKTFILPTLPALGFQQSDHVVHPFTLKKLDEYALTRDFPAENKGSYLSPHLRFGTVSIRQIINQLNPKNEVFISELIWREFFIQILFNFPEVQHGNFKTQYNGIVWRNNEKEFERWCSGNTGFAFVDAGMRELNATGYMHNRVRMIVAGFLCKHLLIDWRWGEAYFAEKLLDYELASNNGNWQWSAGTGCDSAPYFRIFNPYEQHRKFDKENKYIKKWIPEYGTLNYPAPMVDHAQARLRALAVYKKGLNQ